MAKIYGLFGSMTGKLADTVMSVRNGEQIARKYQPVVYNPSTNAQVAQRAKLKLLSQLSAVMSSGIAIPREGSVSSRNLFTKLNFRYVSYADNQASVDLNSIQLTKSVVGMPELQVVRGQNINAFLNVPGTAGENVDFNRVVYLLFEKRADDSLSFVTSRVVNAAGASNNWEVTDFPAISDAVVVYAYTVRDNNDRARATFGNMQALTAEQVAKLVVTRTLTESDVTLSETKAVTLAAGSRGGGDVKKSPENAPKKN